MKKHLSTIVICLVFFIGLSIMLYPAVSDWWNSRVSSRAVANYDAAVAEMSQEDKGRLLEEAEDYNRRLAANSAAFYQPELIGGYNEILDVTGTGIMGYVSIPRISVELPIYHGLEDTILQIAAGHMEGTSFPVGGASTHAVVSGHRGLPSAKLFTDLDQLVEGDRFSITVLDCRVTYAVDQIRIVEPDETDELRIIPGEDHVTLLTCTPYGINSHRMLIRGVRVSDAGGAVYVTSEAMRIDPLLVAPAVALPMLLALLVALLVKYRRRKV